mmetsp:Transcript_7782/g.19115  ORF Transcript_7782/g.19115 Transcript_7782/m.19115 type:complete len:333 (-) Transcript_7782:302-1300(-)
MEVLQIAPGRPELAVDFDGHLELEDGAHHVPNLRRHLLDPAPVPDFEEELVVDLSHESGRAAHHVPLVSAEVLPPHHRALDEVRGGALDDGVHGLALRGLPLPPVLARDGRQEPLALENGLHVSPLPRKGFHGGGEVAHTAEESQKGALQRLGLGHGDVQLLREAHRGRAVDDGVGHPLGNLPRASAGARDAAAAKPGAREGRENIRALPQNLDQLWVRAEVGQNPQLDRLVVHRQKQVIILRWDEGASHVDVHRLVAVAQVDLVLGHRLQVGVACGQPSRRRPRLVPRAVNLHSPATLSLTELGLVEPLRVDPLGVELRSLSVGEDERRHP